MPTGFLPVELLSPDAARPIVGMYHSSVTHTTHRFRRSPATLVTFASSHDPARLALYPPLLSSDDLRKSDILNTLVVEIGSMRDDLEMANGKLDDVLSLLSGITRTEQPGKLFARQHQGMRGDDDRVIGGGCSSSMRGGFGRWGAEVGGGGGTGQRYLGAYAHGEHLDGSSAPRFHADQRRQEWQGHEVFPHSRWPSPAEQYPAENNEHDQVGGRMIATKMSTRSHPTW